MRTVAPNSNDEKPALAPPRDREQGLALLAVLWIIASATLLVASFNMNVRSGLSFVRSEVQLSQTDALLDAGLEIAATRLIDQEPSRRWKPDGLWRTLTFAGAPIRIRVQDPNGLVDLNKADEALLLEFFKGFGVNANEAKLITDRIIVARGQTPGATEDLTDDEGAGAKRAAAAARFMDVGQLRQIEGMSIDLFRRVSPFMTVFGSDGSVNPLTAPNEVYGILSKRLSADARTRREEFQASQKNPNPSADKDDEEQRTDDFGPAFTITVEGPSTGRNNATGKTFVIATGLDPGLPYRILSVRPAATQR